MASTQNDDAVMDDSEVVDTEGSARGKYSFSLIVCVVLIEQIDGANDDDKESEESATGKSDTLHSPSHLLICVF